METQATRATLGHKILAIFMSIVLVVGLSPTFTGAQAAYADDDLQVGQISTQAVEQFSYGGTNVDFVKADLDEFGMFRPQEGTTVALKDNNVVITYKPKTTTVYTGFFLNADVADTATWKEDSYYALDAESGTFSITLPDTYCGYAWPVVPVKSDKKTPTSAQYYLAIPAADEIPTVDELAASIVDNLIAKIQVQTRTETTDADCKAAKDAWDALTPAQKELVEEGDYFGLDTGDASLDNPLATAPDKANEILVVSFGTSYNASRVATIGAIEKAIQAANPDWSVRRAFTAQIIINHIQARDGEKINNVDQALVAAEEAGVKNLVIAPTHLMHGAEYDELVKALKPYESKMNIRVAEPLLGEVGADASAINADKEAVAKAVVAAAVKEAGYDTAYKAHLDKAAIVLMGHGTAHDAKVTYQQMQAQMKELDYQNVFVGTVEGEPESTSVENVIAAVKAAGYTKVFLRPLMVVAGDHANNDMADPEAPDSWYNQFVADDAFSSATVKCQINGLGEIPEVQQLYVNHVAKVMPGTTELEISNLSKLQMFKAVSASVTMNADGSALLTMALSKDGYHYLFKGTKEQAIENGDNPANWIAGTVNAYGKWEFQIPITADEIGKAVPVVSISDDRYNKYKTQGGSLASAFYARQLVVNPVQGTLETNDLVTAADVDALIEAIQVQKRTETTDADCAAAKKAWDELIDPLREQVNQADYFESTGDASKDDPLNADKIGDNEILVVSFGTSYTDNRIATIGAIEKAIQAANPDWSVRRAFTAQIIINHIQARDGEVIDNMDQALERAVANGVKNLVIAPTHLMHGAEYDELVKALKPYESKMNIKVAEPLLGEVGADASVINADKEAVAKAVVAAAVKEAGYADAAAADADKAAIVLMGHGTAHDAKVTYQQMQTVMGKLGYKNVFVGTVEGEPESTSVENVIAAVKAAGYTKVFLRPLMVVAGDHANNDMADPEAPDSWYSMFKADGSFGEPICQIAGLGEIPAVQNLYIQHVAKVTGDTPAPTPEKKDATVKIVKKKSFKAAQLKKAKKSFRAVKVTTDGKVTYKVTKNSNKKYIKFKAGKVTVAKGTPKGKYTVKGKVSAKAGTEYKALKAQKFAVTVTVKKK